MIVGSVSFPFLLYSILLVTLSISHNNASVSWLKFFTQFRSNFVHIHRRQRDYRKVVPNGSCYWFNITGKQSSSLGDYILPGKLSVFDWTLLPEIFDWISNHYSARFHVTTWKMEFKNHLLINNTPRDLNRLIRRTENKSIPGVFNSKNQKGFHESWTLHDRDRKQSRKEMNK